ncbi:MAG: sucrase ferredoxin [Moorea sp. SIO2I5]|nr:sucrase ferredoxin [Moorena sp. SIO2I5]
MLTQDTLVDCRFCSLVSKANGEDPIGTARTVDHWLLLELAQPWTKKMFQEDPRFKPLIELFKQLFIKRGVMMQPVFIAPDREYSQPGKTRVIYYHRTQKQFAEFEKREFIVPEAKFTKLVTALLKHLIRQPNEFSQFEPYEQETSHIREMLVCTHGNVDVACARFGYPIYKKLRDVYASEPNSNLRVWRCSHIGGHKFAPTLIDLPDGRYWGHLEPEVLDLLVHRQGDVTKLRSFYRGWTGLGKFEQVAEREIWMNEGWEWLLYHKYGKTTRKGLKGVKQYLYNIFRLIPLKQIQASLEQWTKDATWAEVQIQFTSPDQTTSGTYRARVELSGHVMSVAKSRQSGEEMQLESVPQYQVSSLVKQIA